MDFSSALINMIKPSLPHESFVNLAKEINNIFTSSKDGNVANSITDTLLLESVREQIHADNLSPKSEFIDKVSSVKFFNSPYVAEKLVDGVYFITIFYETMLFNEFVILTLEFALHSNKSYFI